MRDGIRLVAHGTTASFDPPEPPQTGLRGIWAEVFPSLSRDAYRSLLRRLIYMQAIGVEVDRPVFDRMAAVARHRYPEQSTDEAPAAPARPSVVYYIRVGSLVKIGVTTGLTHRIKAYPPDATLLATEAGDRAVERQRHEQFAESLAHGREWFFPSAALIAHINLLRGCPLTAGELAG